MRENVHKEIVKMVVFENSINSDNKYTKLLRIYKTVKTTKWVDSTMQ